MTSSVRIQYRIIDIYLCRLS